MAVSHPLMSETYVWFDKQRVEEAEANYYAGKCGTGGSPVDGAINSRMDKLEQENKGLKKVTDDLRQMIKNLENRISTLEGGKPTAAVETKDNKQAEEDDEDFELFGSDDEEVDAAAEKLKQERVAAYNAKKQKKPVLIAKSNIILDVKPWADDTDLEAMEKAVRSITMDGLLWGASKFVAVGYGIRKLQISTVVEDAKVSVDDIQEQIEAFEDYVQSVDIAAFNKI